MGFLERARPDIPRNQLLELLNGRSVPPTSFSGPDFRITIYIPPDRSADFQGKTSIKECGEIATITMSSHRGFHPVRALGEHWVREYVGGTRTVAGTIISVVFDRDVFADIYQLDRREGLSPYPMFIDQLPPFTIGIHGSTELGYEASMFLLGVRLTNWGMNLSVDDLFSETTFCVDPQTQALTARGWKRYDQIDESDDLLTIDPISKEIRWSPCLAVHTFLYRGFLSYWRNSRGVDMMTTPNHRWLCTKSGRSYADVPVFDRDFFFEETRNLPGSTRLIITSGGTPKCFSSSPVYSDEFVELVAWHIAEGTIHFSDIGTPYATSVSQSAAADPIWTSRIRQLSRHFALQGASVHERGHTYNSDQRYFYFGKGVYADIEAVAPSKCPSPEFLRLLTVPQAELFRDTLLRGDGSTGWSGTERFIQNAGHRVDAFQAVCAMLGQRTGCRRRAPGSPSTFTTVYRSNVLNAYGLRELLVPYEGPVWCPQTAEGTWLARRNGNTFWTGNSYVAKWATPFLPGFYRDNLDKVMRELEPNRDLRASSLAPLSPPSLNKRDK